MDSLVTQLDVIRNVVAAYAKNPVNGLSYLLESSDGNVLAVVDIYTVQGQRDADAGLIVRIVGDYIVVERDQNDKILLDALVQAGIPREQIVLAYAGEPVPDVV